MKHVFFIRAAMASALCIAPCGLAGVRAGQTDSIVPSYPDADALAAEMRILGANPRDEGALIKSGELTLKIGDIDAAAAFFMRAEQINPVNARTKAGTARALLHMERPGEALRFFDQAIALGIDPVVIASERGLAYDLIGEQERAQRQYRLALTRGPDEETLRRYALSLGIVGKRDQALEQIDALLRQSDRAAWRVRAFVLAMTGDVAGAETIATSMLPGTMASGLLPFFRVLASLGPTDRAFAVHFGEVRPTPQRIADARLIPDLPVLAPEPVRPAPVALAQASPAKPSREAERRERRDRRRRNQPVAAAAATPVPVTPPPLPEPPRMASAPTPYPVPVAVTTTPTATPTPSATRAATPTAPVAAAAAQPTYVPPAPGSTAARILAEVRARQAMEAKLAATPAPVTPASRPAGDAAVATSAVPTGPTEADAPVLTTLTELPKPTGAASSSPVFVEPVEASTAELTTMTDLPRPSSPMSTPPAVVASAATPASTPPPTPAAPANSGGSRASVPDAAGDAVLARIVASIDIPAEELDVPPVAVPVAAQVAATEPSAKAPPSIAEKPATPEPAKPGLDKKAAAKAAAAKAAADKIVADKKAADKKAAEEKAAKAKALKAEPARVWVQVAGGSSVRDLPRAWAKLRDAAPAAFRGKTAYTTPLRFTNRLLTGPFKDADAAQAFVNTIAKAGLTGFVFTSEAGQKIDKLPPK